MSEKVKLEFTTISQAIRDAHFPPVEIVIGIASGGIVPAGLIAHQLGCALGLIVIHYRAADNTPEYPQPVLIKSPLLPNKSMEILLVDEVSVSGATLATALSALEGHHVTTCVMKGIADMVLFPEIASCVDWPWKI